MKFIYILMLVLCSIACSCNETNYEGKKYGRESDGRDMENVGAYLSGVILDSIAEVEYLIDGRLGLNRVQLESNRFTNWLPGNRPQIVRFHPGNNTYPIYLAPGDSLRMEFYNNDLINGFNRISFSGGHVDENKILLGLRKVLRYGTTEHDYFYNCPESTFLRKIDSLRESSRSLLETSEMAVTATFKSMYTTYVDYELAHYIVKYPRTKRYGFGDGIVAKSEEFLKRERTAFLEDPNLLDNAAYRGYLSKKLQTSIASVFYHPGSDSDGSSVPSLAWQVAMIDTLFNNNQIKNYLKFSIILRELNVGSEDVGPALASFKNQDFAKAYFQILEEVLAAKEERLSESEYMFEDSSGIQRSLCDLEGKIIYVDLWATWCTPCLIQSKYFEELARTFEPRNDDIEFVGISLDHDVDRWKEMLKDGDFEGIQLLAKDGFNSKICQDFEIREIPRFMVFDRDGIVIRPNALPPSRDGLEDYLNSLLEER